MADHRDNGGQFYAHKVDRDTAFKMPMIQVNGPRCIRYLCFDIDRKFGALAWEDANLPLPNLIMTNPKNGHAHLLYEIKEGIWKKSPKDPRPGEALPVRYLQAVYKAMAEALGADKSYPGLLVKNPLHDAWTVTYGNQQPYTLGELSAHLDLLPAPKNGKLIEDVDGRNCTLFCSLRFFSYRVVNEYRDNHNFLSFKDDLWDELQTLNDELPNPLMDSELRGILKSVAKWTWKNYQGDGKIIRRGVMGLDPSLSLRVRQQLAQKRTCDIRVGKTEKSIKDSILQIQSEDISVSISEVSRRTKFSRNTVRVYWSKLSDMITHRNTIGTGSVPDESFMVGVTPQDLDSLIPSELNILGPGPYRYCEPGRLFLSMTSQTFDCRVFEALDKWRTMESPLHDQRITN